MVVIVMKKKAAKRWTLLLAMLLTVTFLSSCSSSLFETESDSLCLPNVEWGSSIDDTLSAFDTTREKLGEDFYASGNYGNGYAILKDETVFGVECTDMLLSFELTADKSGSLIYAAIHYPQNADMDKVLAEMKKNFGESEEEIIFFPYSKSWGSGKFVSDSINQYWAGMSLTDRLSEDEMKKVGVSPYINFGYYFTRARWSKDYQDNPSANGENKLSETPNVVILDARYLSEINNKLNPVVIDSPTSE